MIFEYLVSHKASHAIRMAFLMQGKVFDVSLGQRSFRSLLNKVTSGRYLKEIVYVLRSLEEELLVCHKNAMAYFLRKILVTELTGSWEMQF